MAHAHGVYTFSNISRATPSALREKLKGADVIFNQANPHGPQAENRPAQHSPDAVHVGSVCLEERGSSNIILNMYEA